jgi:hypothetical protein
METSPKKTHGRIPNDDSKTGRKGFRGVYRSEHIAGDNTKMAWEFEGKMDYPTNLMLLFMDFDGIIGDDFQVGLQNLKKNLEN